MFLRFVTLDQLNDLRKDKLTLAIYVQDITGHQSLFLEQLDMAIVLMFGLLVVLLLNFYLVSPYFQVIRVLIS